VYTIARRVALIVYIASVNRPACIMLTLMHVVQHIIGIHLESQSFKMHARMLHQQLLLGCVHACYNQTNKKRKQHMKNMHTKTELSAVALMTSMLCFVCLYEHHCWLLLCLSSLANRSTHSLLQQTALLLLLSALAAVSSTTSSSCSSSLECLI
jgi:hypothetical protein